MCPPQPSSKIITLTLIISLFIFMPPLTSTSMFFILEGSVLLEKSPHSIDKKMVTNESAFPAPSFQQNKIPHPFKKRDSQNTSQGNLLWGNPMKLANQELQRKQYAICQDPEGIFYCVWLASSTMNGLSFYYSYSEDDEGLDWSSPEIILRITDELVEFSITVDNRGTKHLFYISEREDHSRLNHVYQNIEENNWTHEVIYGSQKYQFSSLTTAVVENATVNVAWVSTDRVNETNRCIHFTQKNELNVWLPEILVKANNTNPSSVQLARTRNNTLQMGWTVNSQSQGSYTLLFAYMDLEDYSIANIKTIVSNVPLKDFLFKETPLGNIHFLWIENEQYDFLYHGELLTNGTLVYSSSSLNNESTICYLGGIFEDHTTGTTYTVFEEQQGLANYLVYRKREGGNINWNASIILTNNSHSIDCKLFSNQKKDLGQLFYLSLYSPCTRHLDNNEQWSNAEIIYQNTRTNENPTMVVDSEGILHLVWYHQSRISKELIYAKKLANSSLWEPIEVITTGYTVELTPSLLVDGEDTLYCVFIARDNETNLRSIYYIHKTKEDMKWSNPLLIKKPEVEASEYHAPILLMDSMETLSLFWIELVDDYQRLFFAQKQQSSEEFSQAEMFETSSSLTHIYDPEVIIDASDTLHLIYSEYTPNEELSRLVYRKKPVSSSWSDPNIITVSNDFLFNPELIINSNNVMQLFISNSLVLSPYLQNYESSIEFYEKTLDQSNWELTTTVAEGVNTAGSYSIIQLPDNSLYAFFYDLISENWWSNNWNFLYVKKMSPEGSWTESQKLCSYQFRRESFIAKYLPNQETSHIIFSDSGLLYWISTQKDSDDDSVGDTDEYQYCTDLSNPDCDGDGVPDGIEIHSNYTNPIFTDTDWDELTDGEEINTFLSDPLRMDTDRDSLLDGDEVHLYGTSPTSSDTDKDKLWDEEELFLYNTNPNSPDTDADGMDDYWELQSGLNPNVDDAAGDGDEDNLTNIEEYQAGTLVDNPDCDNDYLLDGEEIKEWLTNPLDSDTDSDTLTDYEEVTTFHTSPFAKDTDQDGFTDREEIDEGTDPNNPKDNVQTRRLKRIIPLIVSPIVIVSLLVISLEINYRIQTKKFAAREEKELEKEEEKLEKVLERKKKSAELENKTEEILENNTNHLRERN
ncbi:MAG: hypothetical protein GF308_01025 [Candidatus Heimdallarchaeota archaeon]|nr:hypothetical protein [Candidatus Heimdallarchaeota archaeon]